MKLLNLILFALGGRGSVVVDDVDDVVVKNVWGIRLLLN